MIINETPAPQPAPRTIALDPEKLYVLIDRERRRRGMTWRGVSRALGERSASSPARLGQGKSVSGDLLVRILAWLGWPEHQTYTSHPDFRDQG